MNRKAILKKLKRESFFYIKKKLLILLLVGGILLYIFGQEAYVTVRGPKDINEISIGKRSKEYATADIDAISSYVFYDDGKPFYFIDCGLDQYIFLLTKDADTRLSFSNIRKIIDSESVANGMLTITGGLRELNKTEKQQYDRWIELHPEYLELPKGFALYTLVETETPYGDKEPLTLIAFLGVTMIVYDLLSLISLIFGGYQKGVLKTNIQPNSNRNKTERQDKILALYGSSVMFKGVSITEEYVFFCYHGYTHMVEVGDINAIYINKVRKKRKKPIKPKPNALYTLFISVQNQKVYKLKSVNSIGFIDYIKENREELYKVVSN